MTDTLAHALGLQPNDHSKLRADFEGATGIGWHTPTPARLAAGRAVSVVIPARNTAYALQAVLDSLAAQDTHGSVEVIVVDDGSTDNTHLTAARHPAADTCVRLAQPQGAAAARNVGTYLASSDTILYLDSDMVLPPHALADFAARAQADTVLTGFRHNVPFQPGPNGAALVPQGPADLATDHRVTWRSDGGTLLYSGHVLSGPATGSPLNDTDDFQKLGHGAFYLDWDLARTVVTAMVAVPRAAVIDVGGFDETFGRIGWGMEDTHLGAALIAAGCLVVPLRQAVGYHLDPPDADAQWQTKLQGWPATLAHYRGRLAAPAPTGRGRSFETAAYRLLVRAEVNAR
ncbi:MULTISPECIES: glycosyltransferase family 2 protein [Streptomyces]|uniref:glycosyltransferase family 2 protein n=1 Tax=Streptomyces TaxID=1883 RepID=UPI002E15F927|nr:glycosyltransferase [Streptomyces subrutilus]